MLMRQRTSITRRRSTRRRLRAGWRCHVPRFTSY